jgi:bifunctional DNase/RNase
MTHEKEHYKRLNIVGFTVDVLQPLALFKDEADETTFPLWLEMSDVLAITADLLTKRLSGKGESNDLLDAVLDRIGLKVTEVLIDGTASGGYSADVCLEGDSGETRVRVELVTALLTAIRYKLPVGISEEALASSSLVDQSSADQVNLTDQERLLEMLERMNPDDMGKYPM